MISVKINNLKTFTSHLLVQDTFSAFLLVEAQIQTHSVFAINGRKNEAYFATSEEDVACDTDYNTWGVLRPICYEIIKGKNLPTYFKFVLKANSAVISTLLENLPDFKETDIDGLFCNIRYENGNLTITTGTSLKIFTLDKALDKAFDAYFLNFLECAAIDYLFC